MRVLAVVVGVVLVVLVVVVFLDAVATTVVVGAGPGPLTRRLNALLWRGLRRLLRFGPMRVLLGLVGPALLLITVLTWVALLWLGWSLILLGGDPAVVDAGSKAPAGAAEVIYYAGFTLFTLGVGDYVAAGPPWRIVTAIAGFSGLFLVTLAITYLVSVVTAVVNRRAVAVHIHALGDEPAGIVATGWTGHDFSSALVQHLVTLAGRLVEVAEQHLAYPVLHYFASREEVASAPIAVARLDDAMLLLSKGVRPEARPPQAAVRPLRAAVSRYVATVAKTSAISGDQRVPPPPELSALAVRGVPVVPAAEFTCAADAEALHRCRLHRLSLNDMA